MKPATLLAVVLFSLVAVAHLLRVIFQVEVVVDGAAMPMWISVVGFVVPGLLALALWRDAHPHHA